MCFWSNRLNVIDVKTLFLTISKKNSFMKTICIVIPVYKSYSLIGRLFSSLNEEYLASTFLWTIYFIDDSPEVDFNWGSFVAELQILNKVFKSIDWVCNKKKSRSYFFKE